MNENLLARALLVACAAAILAGCGQKGPLVLPDAARGGAVETEPDDEAPEDEDRAGRRRGPAGDLTDAG